MNLRDEYVGTAEALGTLGSGVAAQVPGGLAGILEYYKQLARGRALGSKQEGVVRDRAREAAAQKVRDVSEKFTYEPRSEAGRERVGKIGEGIETLGEQAMAVPGVAPTVRGLQDFSADQPLLAAGLLAATEVVGPGKAKPKVPKLPVAREATQAAQAFRLREMGGSGERRMFEVYSQGGNGPILGAVFAPDVATAEQRAVQHFGGGRPQPQHVQQARRGEDPDRILGPGEGSDAPGAQDVPGSGAVQPLEGLHPLYVQAQARERGLSYDEALRALREEDAGGGASDLTARNDEARLADRALDIRLSNHERLLAADQLASHHSARGNLSEASEWANEREQLREQMRRDQQEGGARERPRMTGRDYQERLNDISSRQAYHRGNQQEVDRLQGEYERTLIEMRDSARAAPVGRGPMTELDAPEALPGSWEEFDARAQEAMRQQSLSQKLRHQKELPGVEGKPDYKTNPDLMNREAVAQFLTKAGENPDILQYGLAPPPEVRGIGRMARHFGQKAGEDISLDIETRTSESDEPYKIEKVHGRGEPMRDRYGEYKYEEAERGDTLKDEYGDIKKEEVEKELFGPPREEEGMHPIHGPQLMGTKEVPIEARGGEVVYDDQGNIQYRKSRGGEPVRDERGRPKMEENPDYGGEVEEGERWTMSIPGKGSGELIADIYESGEPMSIDATGVGKGKGGDLLYQTILADASRGDYEIGGTSLTSDNQLRLGANVLANIVRMGVNPRETGGMTSGNANVRLRGQAEGPEVFLANVEETKHRLRRSNVEPDRLRFDGEDFTVDGVVTDPKDLMKAMNWEPGRKSIGQKTLMRMAFFDWLRGTAPEEAARAAASWKKHGPLFSMGGATALGAAALSGEEENAAMQ